MLSPADALQRVHQRCVFGIRWVRFDQLSHEFESSPRLVSTPDRAGAVFLSIDGSTFPAGAAYGFPQALNGVRDDEEADRKLYVLAMFSAIFLPASLIAGIWGTPLAFRSAVFRVRVRNAGMPCKVDQRSPGLDVVLVLDIPSIFLSGTPGS